MILWVKCFLGVFILTVMNCTSEYYDERDKLTGKYPGVMIQTYWNGVDTFLNHDTISVTSIISKSTIDSLVNFTPDLVSSRNYSFVFRNGIFYSTENGPIPHLQLKGDDLRFNHKPGLGPGSIEIIARKIK